jgi:Flp pilus assembly pilin Flp
MLGSASMEYALVAIGVSVAVIGILVHVFPS